MGKKHGIVKKHRKSVSLHDQYGFRNIAVRIDEDELVEVKYKAKKDYDMNLGDFVRYAIDRTLSEAKQNAS